MTPATASPPAPAKHPPATTPRPDPVPGPEREYEMTRAHRIGNLIGVALPPIGVLAAIILLWNSFVGPRDIALMVGFYLLSGLGITIGYHRLFTHRAFKTSKTMRAVFAILGSISVQGSLIVWVADHRKHHDFTDRDGDPHSPHGHGSGFRGAVSGLFHAHMGWLFHDVGKADRKRYAPDLRKDPVLRSIDRLFPVWALLGLLAPAVIGGLLSGTAKGALTGLLWGGFVRIFLLHHVTWSINSVCHFFGRRRFPTDDESRNVFWLAPISFGESWHHNHHAFPTSAFHGLRRGEVDPAGYVITGLEKLGLIWDVVRVSPEKQAQREALAA